MSEEKKEKESSKIMNVIYMIAAAVIFVFGFLI